MDGSSIFKICPKIMDKIIFIIIALARFINMTNRANIYYDIHYHHSMAYMFRNRLLV